MLCIWRVLFLGMALPGHGFKPSVITLGPGRNRFQPANPVELLRSIDRTNTIVNCATHCYREKLCRTFEHDADPLQCRLFVGSVDTGTLVPTSSNIVVGWITIEPALFILYDAPQTQCSDDRFLDIDPSSGRCRCPIFTFWNGSICVNQRFHGAPCMNNSGCRTDIGLKCTASTCLGLSRIDNPSTFKVDTTFVTSTEVTTSKALQTTHASTSWILPSLSSVRTDHLDNRNHSRCKSVFIAVYFWSIRSSSSLSACTTLITFDDLPPTGNISSAIPNGYMNLSWTNIEYLNASSMPRTSGYGRVRSLPNVAHNPTEGNITIQAANGITFSFDSVYLSSAWRSNLSVTLTTFRGSSVSSVARLLLRPATNHYLYCTFCTRTDRITIESSAGMSVGNFSQNGTQLMIDSLCISFGRWIRCWHELLNNLILPFRERWSASIVIKKLCSCIAKAILRNEWCCSLSIENETWFYW